MTEHVTLDGQPPDCVAVHYDTDLPSAAQHFRSVGFHNVTHITWLERRLNCNAARRRALDAAKRGEGKCYWQGDWDYSANQCALYAFKFTSYDGPMFRAPRTPNTEAHVDYAGE